MRPYVPALALASLASLASRAPADTPAPAPTPAPPAPGRPTPEGATGRPPAGPRARRPDGTIPAAPARVDEADAARLPRLKATAFGTISPKIECVDPACTETSPKNFAFSFEG